MGDEKATKNPLASKTIHFNVISAAIWPFLPEHFRKHSYAESALLAWLTIGNIVLRFVTSEALRFFKSSPEKLADSSNKLDKPVEDASELQKVKQGDKP